MNETELLLLQQQMRGNVAGLGYRLEVVGVDTADFTGTRDEDIHRSHLVREANESGQIRKIKYYIDYPGQPDDPQRSVMLRIFEDGHVTCTRPVRPDLFDVVVDEIAAIKEYDNYLTPLNELMEEYIGNQFRGQSSRRKVAYARETNEAFRDLVEQYFDPNEVSGAQHRLYQSLVASFGVILCEDGVPLVDEFDDVDDADRLHDPNGNIQEFFEDYARRVLHQDDIDYNALSSHLRAILQEDWDQPLDIVEHCIEMYDLR